MIIRIYDHSYHEVVSGGDVIAAEFAKAWRTQNHTVTLSTHEEAASFFQSRELPTNFMDVVTRIPTKSPNVLIGSIAHVLNATLDAVVSPRRPVDLIFSCSWSIQDLFPALIDKRKHPWATLVVGCYILLDPPWVKSYGSNWLNRIVFWLEYCLGILLTRLFANMIWTASPADASYIARTWRKRAYAIRGGVEAKQANRAAQNIHNKRFDAVYIGRFHPQKNILELVEIWKLVTKTLPHATLVIAGAGFLKAQLESAIQQRNLKKRITLLPPIDGTEKFTLLAQSKLFVSASHFDTGNLSLDEALACGTPGVIYDLPKAVYPKGIKRIPCFDKQAFANTICTLLANNNRRDSLGKDAQQFGQTLDWDAQAIRALDSLKTIGTQ